MTHVQAISCPHPLESGLRRFVQHRAWSAVLSVSLHILIFAVLAMVVRRTIEPPPPTTEFIIRQPRATVPANTTPSKTLVRSTVDPLINRGNNTLRGAARSTSSQAANGAALDTAGKAIAGLGTRFILKPSDLPSAAPFDGIFEFKHTTDLSTIITGNEIARLKNVRDRIGVWEVNDSDIKGPGGSMARTRARFTVFKAKYQDGDWNCNPRDVENLLLQIKRWSEGRIDAKLHPEVLDIGTDRIFEIMPPFVYLTGHKDFQLLEREVQTLRDYLLVGGAIWADSALVGRHSRFDQAFRREIAKVLPGRDFEAVSPDHDLFHAFFDKTQLPSGMNNYRETAEMINIGSHLAVLYTLNGYGHLWESRLNDKGDIERGLVNIGSLGHPAWSHVYGPHLGNGILYRNVNDASVRDAYQFGINVVVHLLTRYQDAIRFLPKELPPAPEHWRARLEKKSVPAGGDESRVKPGGLK